MIQFQNVSVTIQGNKILDNIREFTAAEFAGLPESERSAMGLRSIRSEEIKIPERTFMQPNASLAVHHISVQRKKRLILNDLSLSANDGDIIGIVGRNGIGKSTFCSALCGLLPAVRQLWAKRNF